MIAPPRVRKLVLTAHIATSVGWFGAVAAYIALDVAAVASDDVQLVRGAYLAMDWIVRHVIAPSAVASILVGIVNGLTTPWGLFRHYWVLVKLMLTAFGTVILLLEIEAISGMAAAAASGADPRALPGSLLHSVGGLAVLLATTVLSVYKPRGLTRYGWHRRQRERRTQPVAVAE